MMKTYAIAIILVLGLVWTASTTQAQNLTVKIRQEKTLPQAHEFIITWEGGDYKDTYYQVKAVLDECSMLEKYTFYNHLQRIGAIVKNPYGFEDLRALFQSRGFAVVSKNDPVSESSK